MCFYEMDWWSLWSISTRIDGDCGEGIVTRREGPHPFLRMDTSSSGILAHNCMPRRDNFIRLPSDEFFVNSIGDTSYFCLDSPSLTI